MKTKIYAVLVTLLLPVLFTSGFVLADREVDRKQQQYVLETSHAPFPELHNQTIANLVNQERAEVGLPSLTYSTQLEASACAKADDMITDQYWGHIAPDGTTPWDFFDLVGYQYYQAGENLAYGQRSDDQVVNGWINSPSHRDNIQNANYSEQGMCVRYGDFRGGKVALIVNHFGSRR